MRCTPCTRLKRIAQHRRAQGGAFAGSTCAHGASGPEQQVHRLMQCIRTQSSYTAPFAHRRTAEAKRMVRLAKKRILAVDTECRAECSKGYLPVVFPLPELSPQPKAPRLGACAGNEHRCPSLREFTSHKMTSWFHPRRTTSAAERWLGCFLLEPRVLDDSVACMPHLVWAFVLKILRLSGFQWDRRSCAANRDVESLRDIAMRSLPRGCTLF